MALHIVRDIKSLKSSVNDLCKEKRISCDTETFGGEGIGGLHPFHGSRAFSIIFATATDEFYFDFNIGGINSKYIELLQPIFDNPEKIIFFVNAIFDATILYHHNIHIKCRIVDCPSIARIEFNCHDGGKYISDESFLSLEYLAEYYKVKAKDDRVKAYIIENDLYQKDKDGKHIKCRFKNKKIPCYELVPLDLMTTYGASDARSTFDIGTKIIKCINHKDSIYKNENKMIEVAKNEIKLTSTLVKMKIDGAKLWVDYVEQAIEKEKEISAKLHKEINELTGGINLNSGKQVAEYLIKRGVNVPKKDPTANDKKQREAWLEKADIIMAQINSGELKSKQVEVKKRHYEQAILKADNYLKGRHITDKKTLARLLKKHPELDFLSKITTAKESDKKLSTYYMNFIKLKDEFDIIHCGLNQEKAITGRFSSSNPNFQNLHKEKWDGSEDQLMIRKSIIPKFEDTDLFFFDYKGQEMYIMIDLAEDKEVIKDILENGTDIYIAMGNMVEAYTGIKITRDQAKALSLGVAYGQGKALIAKNLKCSIDEAEKLKNAFLGSLKGVAKLNKRMMSQAKFQGKIHNPYGRVSYILDKNFSYKALNSLIQGTAADCTKTAMVNLAPLFENVVSHPVLQVHDEIIFEIHKDEHYLIPQIKKIMSEAYPHKHLPLRVDVEHSKRSWGEKTDFKESV